MQNENKKFYRNSSFYTVVFLILKGGLELVGIEPSPTNPNRSVFVLKDSPNRSNLLKELNFAEENSRSVLVDFRKAVAVIKNLKSNLYQEKL